MDNFEYMPERREETIKTIGRLNNTILLIGDSVKLANKFAAESIDAVYIDARHEYEFVKRDLSIWGPKVRRSGVIAGHDYNPLDWPGVIQAVEEFRSAMHLDGLHVFKDTSWAMWRK